MSLDVSTRRWAQGGLRRAVYITLVVALLMLGVALADRAEANADCGSEITTSIRLTHDIGPCTTDGLIIKGNNITVDLGGHTITGNNINNTTPQEQVGIRLEGVSGVTVRNGTVRNFDAGVGIVGGEGNTIESLFVHDNANHSTVTGVRNPCEWGDGIAVLDSSNNRIENNRVSDGPDLPGTPPPGIEGNGPYSGIALVGNSDHNVVHNNQANDNNVDNIHPNFVNNPRPQGHGPCGPFSVDSPVGRPYQDIGIRVEGPGADNNLVTSNTANNNTLNGIAIHGHVCNFPEPFQDRPSDPANTGNTISKNKVRENGFGDLTPQSNPSSGSGISILRQGPLTVVCVAHSNTIEENISMANKYDGIYVGHGATGPAGESTPSTRGNDISRNVVQSNNRHGIFLSGPATDRTTGQTFPGAMHNTLIANRGHNNGEHDGHDANPNCDANKWLRNRFLKVNQPCVAQAGTGWVGGPGRSGDAPGHNKDEEARDFAPRRGRR